MRFYAPTRQNMQERVRNAFPDGQKTILNNTTILHKPPELCLQQDGGNFDNSLDSFFTFFLSLSHLSSLCFKKQNPSFKSQNAKLTIFYFSWDGCCIEPLKIFHKL